MVIDIRNFIDGKFVVAKSEQLEDVPNPATEEIIARVPLSNFEDVEIAVKVAKKAFETWRNTPVPKRARIMFAFHGLLVEQHGELAKLVTLENGKNYDEAYGEVLRGIECVEFAAGAPSHMKGEVLSTIATEMDSAMYRYPVGVVAGITPFNFPMMVPCWMFPLAIALGNTFVLKPSERTPILASRLAELLKEAGLPDGVFNIVHGARDVVNGLLEHKDIKAVSFVGSQPVAEYVYKTAANNGKRVQALAGAKNQHIVMPDADMEQAVKNIVMSSFGSAGERCMACSSVIAVGDAGDKLVAYIKEKADEIVTGNGLDEGVFLGPLIRESHKTKVLGYIELAEAEGATLVRDGREDAKGFDQGYFLGATIFDHVNTNMTIFKEEIFAPVLSIVRAENLDDALDKSNQTRFGNSAVIYTNDAKAIRRFREEAEAGMLGVNVGVPAPMAFFPFSGWKDSFYGDLHANGN
ncbi:MAG: CoA-acylating methylmalonate-semialdehyde dehydrogenase, partial [Bacilli bacterium]